MPSHGGCTAVRSKANVLLISTGGTIAMTETTSACGVAPALDGDDLVAAVPGLRAVAALRTLAFRQLPGAHLGVADIAALVECIRGELASGTDGVVVTQGTDTIEETAFVLDLLLGSDAPVVVTGAMRNPTVAGADGPANLIAAVQVAAYQPARGLGVLVVLNDEIHAARCVCKWHTSRVDAFVSVPGPLGWVVEGRPRIVLRPATRLPVLPPPVDPPIPVALVKIGIGDDGRTLRALADLGYGGAVVEALGGGHVSPNVALELGRLSAQMPVVLSTRPGRGETLRDTYEFPGSERDLLRRGLIPAGWLDGPKARVVMLLALASGSDRAQLARIFEALAGNGSEGPAEGGT